MIKLVLTAQGDCQPLSFNTGAEGKVCTIILYAKTSSRSCGSKVQGDSASCLTAKNRTFSPLRLQSPHQMRYSLTTRDARENCLSSRNCFLAVNENREHSRSNLGGLDDDVDSIHWIRVLTDRAAEAGQSAGSSSANIGARVERRRLAREGSKEKECWVVNTGASWLVAWERVSGRHWRADWRRERSVLYKKKT